jgi:hypothetical protein
LKRFRTFAPAAAIAAVALAALVGAASGAASANGGGGGGGVPPAPPPPGVLEASGDGIAAAAGKLTLRICATDAILLAKGAVTIAPDAFLDEVGWLGLHVYFGFSGCADVAPGMSMLNGGGGDGAPAGSRAAALAAGTGLTLRAEGIGLAFLRGTGTWANSNGQSGPWTEHGVILHIFGKPAATPCPVHAQHYGRKPVCGTPAPTKTSTAAPEPTSTSTPAPEPTATPTAVAP